MGWLRRGRGKAEVDPVAWVGGDDRSDDDEPGAAASAPPPPPDDDASPGQPAAAGAPLGREHGPWDVSEVEGSEGYLDLGGLWLPGRDGMELRLEVEEQTERVIAATVQLGGSAVQLQAFAAPKSAGIWDEIRTEIAASVTQQGGTADDVPGPFGRELLARVPAMTADGRSGHQPARFAGIDGPRWFLRAVFHGEAAFKPERALELESLVRDVVVIRGTEAMAPRELLSLTLPQVAEAGDGEGASAPDGSDPGAAGPPERETLRPPERGPEITEVR